MSEKAVGFDWLKKITPTLRHSTGCSKFTGINGVVVDKKSKKEMEEEKAQKKNELEQKKAQKLQELEAKKAQKLQELEAKKAQKKTKK
jgi:hypothetical protein